MKHVLGFVARILFYIFCAVVLVWTGSLTVKFVSTVLPGSTVEPFLALGIFDGGALVWLLVFLYGSKGLGQRAVSLLMLVLDLIGVGVMTIAALFLGGQTYTVPLENLGEIAVWVLAGWTFMNLAAAYAFHLLAPGAQHEITMGVAQDKVKAQALSQMEHKMDEISAQVAEELSAELLAGALRDLGARARMPAALPAPSEARYQRAEPAPRLDGYQASIADQYQPAQPAAQPNLFRSPLVQQFRRRRPVPRPTPITPPAQAPLDLLPHDHGNGKAVFAADVIKTEVKPRPNGHPPEGPAMTISPQEFTR